MVMKKITPRVVVETPKNRTAIVGYTKNQLPEVVKKVTKRNLKK